MYSVFSEEEVDRPVSGTCLSGRRKEEEEEEEEMYHALVNEDDIVHVLTIPDNITFKFRKLLTS